ncbi:YbaK/EbsC family protein [Nakamurella lactea]|uniref:YbaK/EbsC family protein n=1 Tax=Nakamurella lactea TaxID=459515 RepID=UPI0003F81F0B|nr:YbaK/EbsC family protein [Nakamurella lactea]
MTRSEEAAEHPSIAGVRAALAAGGVSDVIRVFDAPVKTAAAAAAALDCEVGAIANSLVFDADGAAVLILTSGAHRVDTAKVAAAIGVGALGRATPELVRRSTGQVIGGVSPVGHPAPIPAYLDAWLARYQVIWAAAGHPDAVFRTTFDELRRLTDATVMDVE